MAMIDGQELHFLHIRSPEPDALPLLMMHGWPGSVLEFRKVIGPLTDPAAHGGDLRRAFHIIAPSMPGFGFSGKPASTGCGLPQIADLYIKLMAELGYTCWGMQGRDLGRRRRRRHRSQVACWPGWDPPQFRDGHADA